MAFKLVLPHTTTGTADTIKSKIGKGEIAIKHPEAGGASLFTVDAKGAAVEFPSVSTVESKISTAVGNKNVSATGDTYVSASASNNKVTVGATSSLIDAVRKANSAVQQLTLTGAVTGSATSTAGTMTLETTLSGLDASKITSGTISIDRLPQGALERLFLLTDKNAALTKYKEGGIQEGDSVKLTGDSNTMYICIASGKTTFDDAFTPYTAGSATSVPWAGVTGKPSSFTPSAHNQASNTITAMTEYAKPTSTSAISTGDTLNSAIGKLERALDGKQVAGSYMPASTSVVNHLNSMNGDVNISGGTNITVTVDSTNKKLTINNNYSYSHPSTHPASMIIGLAKVATSGSYNDLTDKPSHYQAKNVVCATSGGTANASATTGNVRLNLIENGTVRSTHKIIGSGSATVTSDKDGNITIYADKNTDTNHNTTNEVGHYTPSGTNGSVTSTAGAAVVWSGTVITGITLDSKKHVTGITTGTIPANPNTDTHWTSNTVVGATNTATANAAATNGNVFLNHIEAGVVRNAHKIVGSGATNVTSDKDGNITISSSNSTYSFTSGTDGSFTVNSQKVTIGKPGTAGTADETKGTLTFTGASTATFNGASSVSVNIPVNTDSKVKNTASANKAFILGVTTQATTSEAVTASKSYMQNYVLYSNDNPVLTCAANGTVSASGLSDRDIILDCGTF